MGCSQKELALLSLYFAKGIGPVYQARLLEKFGNSIGEVLAEKDFSFLVQSLANDFPTSLLKNVYEDSTRKRAEKELDWLEKNQARIFSFLDPEYPPLLKNIYHPPALLFSRGNFSDWNGLTPIAFVGTREPTDYGRKVVENFIELLQETNVIIVSGFAKGIDTFAHKAALRVNLPTIGVLGTGLDYIYPRENEELYYEMIETGRLFTQHATQTIPHPGNFPDRNRIISGISKGVLVIEAPEESGALITARFALEQNREVLAVPGNIFSLKNRGCHRLIHQGAKLVERIEDLLEELQITRPLSISNSACHSREGGNPPGSREIPPPLKLGGRGASAGMTKMESDLDPTEKIVLEKLSNEPQQIDKIFEISTLPPSLVAGILTTLVLKGLVQELPGKFFIKN